MTNGICKKLLLKEDGMSCAYDEDGVVQIHSPTDSSEDSVEVKVNPISLRCKRKELDSVKKDTYTIKPPPKKRIRLQLSEEQRKKSREPFRPWNVEDKKPEQSSFVINPSFRDCLPLYSPVSYQNDEEHDSNSRNKSNTKTEILAPEQNNNNKTSSYQNPDVIVRLILSTDETQNPTVTVKNDGSVISESSPNIISSYSKSPRIQNDLHPISSSSQCNTLINHESFYKRPQSPMTEPLSLVKKSTREAPSKMLPPAIPDGNTRVPFHPSIRSFSGIDAKRSPQSTHVLPNCSHQISQVSESRNEPTTSKEKQLLSVKNLDSMKESGITTGQKREQRNYKNMTRERRIEANARERTRVHTISAAFESLRKTIPSYSHNQKLSKLSVLRIACAYIATLSTIVDDDNSDNGDNSESKNSLTECVENVTRIIQKEGKLRKKKDDGD